MQLSESRHNTGYDQRHGGPFDRGTADSYYGRDFDPHYFVGGTYVTKRIPLSEMSTQDIVAYSAGFSWNEKYGHKKEY